MLQLISIPIVQETSSAITNSSLSFFTRPIDVVLFDIFIYFGWIPILITLIWGFSEIWLNNVRGAYSSKIKYVLLAIDVPSLTEQTPKALENLFSTLYGAKSSITFKEKWLYGKLNPVFSFEIVSTEGYIQFLIRTQTRFRDVVEAGIYAHYPEAEISEVDDYTQHFPSDFPDEEHDMWGAELKLDKPSMYPIRTYVDFEDRMTGEIKDPLGYTLEQMAKMRPGEHFWIQILVQPSTNDWIKPGIKRAQEIYGVKDTPSKSTLVSLMDSAVGLSSEVVKQATNVDLLSGSGEGETDDPWQVFKITQLDRDEAEVLLNKTKKVGHGAKIRILYTAKKNAFVKTERTAMVKGVLNQYANLQYNRFALYIPQVPKDDYFWMRWSYTRRQRNLMAGYKGRSWGIGADPMFLNAEELASLWHFPTISIKAPLVKKTESKRSEPPVGLPITMDDDTLLGVTETVPEMPEDDVVNEVTKESLDEIALPTIEGDLMFPEEFLPNISAPTQKENNKDDADEEVPTNLPT